MTIEKPSQCSAHHDVPNNERDMLGGFRVFYHAEEYCMNYFVVSVISITSGGEHIYESGEDSENFDTYDPDNALWQLRGWVKWDGCSDMDIGGTGGSYRNHFCGYDDAKKVGRMINAVYELAATKIEAWDEELGA